jgi:glycosyltransferase involved in cell wall biosynthesis
MSRKGLNPIVDLFTLVELVSLYLRDKPSVIFHYTIKPNILGSIGAGLLRIPSVAITTGLGHVFGRDTLLAKFVSLLCKLAFLACSQVWFLNKDDMERFLSLRIVPQGKAVVLDGEGIELREFPLSTSFPPVPTFLLVGRMLWEKGVGDFVEAAKLLRSKYQNVRFQLLGPVDCGNPSSIPKSKIDEWQALGVVEYLGAVDDVRPAIIACSALVLPSFYREGVPRVLLEGAALGRPIITTDNVGCREVVLQNQSGLLVPTRNHLALAAAIESLILAPEETILSLGATGRRYVEQRFDVSSVVSRYLKFVNLHI